MNTTCLLILTTTPKKADGQNIARLLVRERAAACVQIVGRIESRYRWKGKIEEAQEWLCIIKTTTKNFKKVERLIRTIHPYEVPEIVAVPLVAGGDDYLSWLSAEVASPSRSRG